MEQPVTLPLYCPRCDEGINITVKHWNYGAKLYWAELTCPHCTETTRISLPGTLVAVAPRATPPK